MDTTQLDANPLNSPPIEPTKPQEQGRVQITYPSLIQDYLDESGRFLHIISKNLIAPGSPGHKKNLDTVFRAFHALRSISDMMGFSDISRVAHAAENLMEIAKKKRRGLPGNWLGLGQEAANRVEQMTHRVREGIHLGSYLQDPLDRTFAENLQNILSTVSENSLSSKLGPGPGDTEEGHYYRHLSISERQQLASLKNQGLSVRAIAAQLNRSHSTIVRELKRNAVEKYTPELAHHNAVARRKS